MVCHVAWFTCTYQSYNALFCVTETLYYLRSRIAHLQGVLTTQKGSEMNATLCDLFSRHVYSKNNFSLELWEELKSKALACQVYLFYAYCDKYNLNSQLRYSKIPF